VQPDMDAWKLFVFRKHRDELQTEALCQELIAELEAAVVERGSIVDALVRAGEIETGLADCGTANALEMAAIVDRLAAVACGFAPCSSLRAAIDALRRMSDLPPINCSHCEGFSYYGLHPLDFADLAERIQQELRPVVAVIGIRTAGATLSAIVRASLQHHHQNYHQTHLKNHTATAGDQVEQVERETVRPEGEPYHRVTRFSEGQSQWIGEKLRQNADFVIVDEGPGFSGSTFLSVARALLEAGVPHTNIVLMTSRPLNAASGAALVAEWKQFRSFTIDYGTRTPPKAQVYIGNGLWRERFYRSHAHWPGSWTLMERSKYIDSDGSGFQKFEGFGRYGQLCRRHAEILAEAGLSPQLNTFEDGYASYELLIGRPLACTDLTAEVLSHMAGYCAFRVKNLPAKNIDTIALANMRGWNMSVELGTEISKASRSEPSRSNAFWNEPPVESPVYPDCRMMPHEWLQDPDGRIVKTDSVDHAEGHHLPGPVDIAWDLAGAIIEWRLSPPEVDFFLREYQRQSGENAVKRIPQYLLLYAIFRSAQCRMGAASMAQSHEGAHLQREYRRYAESVKQSLGRKAA